MTVKLVLSLALLGFALGQGFSSPSVEQVSLDEEMADEPITDSVDMEDFIPVNATAAGIAAAIAAGAPLNSTDEIAEAITDANATTNATEAGAIAALATGVPVDTTTAIAKNIVIAAAENSTMDGIVAAIQAFVPGVNVTTAVYATELYSLLSAGAYIPLCTFISGNDKCPGNGRYFLSSRSKCQCKWFFPVCDSEGFSSKALCEDICCQLI